MTTRNHLEEAALSQKGVVSFILKHAKTAAEIHALGAKPRLPKKEGADPS